MKCLLFCLLLSFNVSTFAKNVLIKLNNNDCASCYSSLYFLQNHDLDSLKFLCLFEAELKMDSVKLIEKFNLKKFKNYKIVFSDSLYRKISKSVISEILIISGAGKIVYRSNLKSMDNKLFFQVLRMDEIGGDLKLSFKDINYRTLNTFQTQSLFGYVKDAYNYSIIFDLQNGRSYEIKIDEGMAERIYTEIEGKSAQTTKAVVDYVIKNGFNDLKPSIGHLQFVNDSTCEFIAWINTIDIKGDDSIFGQKSAVILYNFIGKKIIKCKKLQNELPDNNYSIAATCFFNFKGKYYFHLNTNYDSDPTYNQLFSIHSGFENGFKFLSFSKILLPLNYIQYKLFKNFNQFNFKRGILSMIYSDSIYDLNKRINVKIPLDSNAFDGLVFKWEEINNHGRQDYKKHDYVRILDANLCENGNYRVLYSFANAYYFIDFTEKEIIQKRKLDGMGLTRDSNFLPQFFYNSDYVLNSKNGEDFVRITHLE